MSEDVLAKLKPFTPTMPDRDALLFAAGRASARTSSVWKGLCGVLAMSQAATLAVWVTRTGPLPISRANPVTETEPRDESPSPPPEPYSYLALLRNPDFDRSRPTAEGDFPPRPVHPLTAGRRIELPN